MPTPKINVGARLEAPDYDLLAKAVADGEASSLNEAIVAAVRHTYRKDQPNV